MQFRYGHRHPSHNEEKAYKTVQALVCSKTASYWQPQDLKDPVIIVNFGVRSQITSVAAFDFTHLNVTIVRCIYNWVCLDLSGHSPICKLCFQEQPPRRCIWAQYVFLQSKVSDSDVRSLWCTLKYFLSCHQSVWISRACIQFSANTIYQIVSNIL